MKNDERIIKSFLTSKEQEEVDNIKKENPTLSYQELAKLSEKDEKDVFSYLDEKQPNYYGHRIRRID